MRYLPDVRASLFVETMMISPSCPDHERLVLDLALGRLDDQEALRAEDVRDTCPVCRAWWQAAVEGEVAEVVDKAVAAVFSDLELPERRRSPRWLAAAAIVVMALGVGALWIAQRGTTADPVAVSRTASIRTLDFEVPAAVVEFSRVEVPDPEPEAVAQPAVDGAGGEQIRVAEAALETTPEPLFAASFETGDLGHWVPST
jgi:hypothetical protein